MNPSVQFEISEYSESTVALLNPPDLFQQHPGRLRKAHIGILVLLTLISRWLSRSLPYFVDGPGHVKPFRTERSLSSRPVTFSSISLG